MKLAKVRQTTIDAGWDLVGGRLRVFGDTLILVEGIGTEGVRITATDLPSGKTRWEIKGDALLTVPAVGRVMPYVGGLGEYGGFDKVVQKPVIGSAQGIVPVTYVTGGGRRTTGGVMGVDVRTGEPVWGFPAVGEPSADRALVTAVSDAVVLVTVAQRLGPKWPDLNHTVTSFAVDVRTGAKLWAQRDVIGLAADGDGIVAAKRLADWSACVLDARSGKARWTADRPLSYPSGHVATAADHTVFDPDKTGESEPGKRFDVVRISTGERLEYAWDSVPTPVASDPPLLVWDTGPDWWSKGPNGFVTQPLPTGKPVRGSKRPDGLEFTDGFGVGTAHVWGSFKPTNGGGGRNAHLSGVLAVDRTGTPRSPSIGGALECVTDRWLVVTTGRISGDHEVQSIVKVYRVTST